MNSTLAVDVLARLQGGGLQPFTYIGAMNLASRFQMPERGRQRVWDAISGLKTYKAFKEVLYFGFGYRSAFDLMTQSVSGLKVIALCSALGEMHSGLQAARILSALWQEFQFPEDVEPSHEQMSALIKVCGGALSTSPFVEATSQMINSAPKSEYGPICSDLRELAKALHAIFDVSNGTKKSVTVIGGVSALFIAAVAYWILDLRTHVENGKGDMFFSTSVIEKDLESSKTAQVYVKYLADADCGKLVVSESTYIISSAFDMFGNTIEISYMRHRVPWDKCLHTAFGERFSNLLGLADVLGDIFGSIARMYQGLAEGEEIVQEYERAGFVEFASGSYGYGFTQSVGCIFPELDLPPIQDAMSRSVLNTFSEAEAKLGTCFETLRRNCPCDNCGGEEEKQVKGSRYGCHRQMAATIVDLISTISAIHNPHNISPTVNGLHWFYGANRMFQNNRHDPGHRLIIEKRLVTTNGMLKPNWQNKIAGLLDTVMILFVGTDAGYSRNGKHLAKQGRRIAIASDGLVAYTESLATISTSARSLSSINLVPGHIIRPGNSVLQTPRHYDSVYDLMEWPKPKRGKAKTIQGDFAKPMANSIIGQRLGEIEDSSAWTVTSELAESYTDGGLTFYYRVIGPVEAVIPPGKFTMGVLLHTALAGCSRGQCKPFSDDRIKLYDVDKDWVAEYQTVLQGKNQQPWIYCIWHNASDSTIDRVLALATVFQNAQCHIQHDHASLHPILIRRDECLSCCLRALVQLSGGTDQMRHIMY
ncbi:ankyrin repeat-containing protein [Apiospora arundinis]